LLGRASSVVVASPHGGRASTAEDEFLHRLLRGLAHSHARRLDTDVVPFEPHADPTANRPSALPVVDTGHPTEIVAMLFGDAVHFSRLGEEEVVRFSDEFMGSIGRLIAASQYAPVFTNTWGDGLFFVFRDVHAAGMFALELCELMNGTDWVARGLPAELNLRVGLHAGPVFRWTDPITGRTGYMGTHISRAARIEPITPAGQVYASEAFAALSELAGTGEAISRPVFVCDYVGRTPQAKGYGTFPTYHVRRI
jgi:class 3 adenylate cyclase